MSGIHTRKYSIQLQSTYNVHIQTYAITQWNVPEYFLPCSPSRNAIRWVCKSTRSRIHR